MLILLLILVYGVLFVSSLQAVCCYNNFHIYLESWWLIGYISKLNWLMLLLVVLDVLVYCFFILLQLQVLCVLQCMCVCDLFELM